MRRPMPTRPTGQFEEFQASVLFCNRCNVAQPVRERLLLVLPDGDLYEYLCSVCNTSLGKRKRSEPIPLQVM
jgi:hypothetical protein